MDPIPPGWLLVTSLLSGLVAAGVTIWVRAWLDRREIKRDVLRRLAGNRWPLAGTHPPEAKAEFLVAVNEAFIVFAHDKEVIDALKDLRASNGDAEHIVALIKRMASAAGVPIALDDAFIEWPFTTPSAVRKRAGTTARSTATAPPTVD